MSLTNATAEKSQKILESLKQHYPNAKCALNYSNPLELLISTILSAQCTDERVNIVAKELFQKYRTAKDFAQADLKELETMIHSTGFYHNKAKNIQSACRIIEEKYYGKVPSTMQELILLPGVARKTANIVLSNAFGKIEGIAVDTHVSRLSQRLGFTEQHDANKIEQELMKLFQKKDWHAINYLLIEHGRKVCSSKSQNCKECFLNKQCPSSLAK